MGTALSLDLIVVYWYGLLIGVGILAGGWIASRQARRRGESSHHVWSGLVWCLIPGLIGARLHHVISTPATGLWGWRYYLEEPITILFIWKGGLGIYGALLGGLIGARLYTWRHKLPLWRWLDIAAPGLALAQALVRGANGINQELYGPPTRLPWGVSIDAAHRLPRYADLARYPVETTRFHPTFLYDALWHLGILVLLLWLAHRRVGRLRDGDLALTYLCLFGLGRVWIVQFFRADAWRLGNGLAVEAVIGLMLALAAGVALFKRKRSEKGLAL